MPKGDIVYVNPTTVGLENRDLIGVPLTLKMYMWGWCTVEDSNGYTHSIETSKMLTEEEYLKMKHDTEFNKALEDEIDE